MTMQAGRFIIERQHHPDSLFFGDHLAKERLGIVSFGSRKRLHHVFFKHIRLVFRVSQKMVRGGLLQIYLGPI